MKKLKLYYSYWKVVLTSQFRLPKARKVMDAQYETLAYYCELYAEGKMNVDTVTGYLNAYNEAACVCLLLSSNKYILHYSPLPRMQYVHKFINKHGATVDGANVAQINLVLDAVSSKQYGKRMVTDDDDMFPAWVLDKDFRDGFQMLTVLGRSGLLIPRGRVYDFLCDPVEVMVDPNNWVMDLVMTSELPRK